MSSQPSKYKFFKRLIAKITKKNSDTTRKQSKPIVKHSIFKSRKDKNNKTPRLKKPSITRKLTISNITAPTNNNMKKHKTTINKLYGIIKAHHNSIKSAQLPLLDKSHLMLKNTMKNQISKGVVKQFIPSELEKDIARRKNTAPKKREMQPVPQITTKPRAEHTEHLIKSTTATHPAATTQTTHHMTTTGTKHAITGRELTLAGEFKQIQHDLTTRANTAVAMIIKNNMFENVSKYISTNTPTFYTVTINMDWIEQWIKNKDVEETDDSILRKSLILIANTLCIGAELDFIKNHRLDNIFYTSDHYIYPYYNCFKISIFDFVNKNTDLHKKIIKTLLDEIKLCKTESSTDGMMPSVITALNDLVKDYLEEYNKFSNKTSAIEHNQFAYLPGTLERYIYDMYPDSVLLTKNTFILNQPQIDRYYFIVYEVNVKNNLVNCIIYSSDGTKNSYYLTPDNGTLLPNDKKPTYEELNNFIKQNKNIVFHIKEIKPLLPL